jgi:hypothetical protein
MVTIDQLDYIVIYYSGEAKIARVPFNALLAADPIAVINRYWVKDDQKFYTRATIEYDNRTIFSVDL